MLIYVILVFVLAFVWSYVYDIYNNLRVRYECTERTSDYTMSKLHTLTSDTYNNHNTNLSLQKEIRQLSEKLKNMEKRILKLEPEFQDIKNASFHGETSVVKNSPWECLLVHGDDMFRDAFAYGRLEIMKLLFEKRYSNEKTGELHHSSVPSPKVCFEAYRSRFTTPDCVNYYLEKMMVKENPNLPEFADVLKRIMHNRQFPVFKLILNHRNFAYLQLGWNTNDDIKISLADQLFRIACDNKNEIAVKLMLKRGLIFSQQHPFYLEVVKKYTKQESDQSLSAIVS